MDVADQELEAAVRLQRLKWATRQQSKRLVARGVLRKAVECEKCGAAPQTAMRSNGRPQPWLEMHHPDYNDPTKIVWLCKKCHLGLHGQTLKVTPYLAEPLMWAHNAYGLRGSN